MKKDLFTGCGTAIATPFTKDEVNLEEFKKLLEYQVDNNADAIIVCGTTGEASTMTLDEKIETIKTAVDTVNKRIPVITGTGSNNTIEAIKMSQLAEKLGVDGLLVVTPYYNKTTQNGLIAHYKAIADAVSLPIIMYNVPSRTGVNINPETCLELSKIDNIVAIKEASGNLSQVAKTASLCRNDLTIYSGNDDQILPVLSLGGKGVISVLSNIAPKYTHDMIQNYFDGNIEEAIKMQLDSIDLINTLFSEVNPIPVKYALNEMGYDFGIPRLPLTELSEENKIKTKKIMKHHNLI
ncbi:MAG: 4-hydroxy-tetrahydrodipicolinate synthase [Bacilli bacterium]|nr:4-hydroxy-tetrahydrodipicolinate synthase [Bacilli bacterium]